MIDVCMDCGAAVYEYHKEDCLWLHYNKPSKDDAATRAEEKTTRLLRCNKILQNRIAELEEDMEAIRDENTKLFLVQQYLYQVMDAFKEAYFLLAKVDPTAIKILKEKYLKVVEKTEEFEHLDFIKDELK